MIRRMHLARTLTTWAAACGLTVALGAQQADADRAPNAVVGQVVDQQTGTPVPGARVSAWDMRTYGNAVIADDDGRFVIRDLPAGLFTVRAETDLFGGAVSGAGVFGQKSWDDEPQFISIRAGQVLHDLRVPFWRDAVITGRVTDAEGTPLTGTSIKVYNEGAMAGRRQLVEDRKVNFRNILTDSDGRFRFLHEPGTFYIRAFCTELRSAPAKQGDAPQTLAFPPTFAPNITQVSDAQPVVVAAGEHRAVDFVLQTRPTFRVTGTVRDGRGPVAGTWVTLTRDDAGLHEPDLGQDFQLSVEGDQSGRFVLHAVLPGNYLLEAHPDPETTELVSAERRLTVTNQSVTTELILRRLPTASGHFVFDGSRALRNPSPGLSMSNSDANAPPRWEHFNIVEVDEKNQPIELPVPKTFQVRAYSNRQVLTPEHVPDGWMLKSIRIGDRDVTDRPVDTTRDVRNVTVTLTDRMTRVDGHVTALPGRPQTDTSVWIVPQSRSRWVDYGAQPVGLRTIEPANDGKFTAAGLPPDAYFAIAVPYSDRERLHDAKVLEWASALGTRFSLNEGEHQVVDLRVVALPRRVEHPWQAEAVQSHLEVAVPLSADSAPSGSRRLGSISGRIMSPDGQPVAHAVVRLETWRSDSRDNLRRYWPHLPVWMAGSRPQLPAHTILSNADGRFLLSGIEPGRYVLLARHSFFGESEYRAGGDSTDGSLVIGPGAALTGANITMEQVAAIVGVVQDHRGLALAGVEIHLTQTGRGSNEGSFRVCSDEAGNYRFNFLTPGQYELRIMTVSTGRLTTAADLKDPLRLTVRVDGGFQSLEVPAHGDPPLELQPGEVRRLNIMLARFGRK